MAIIPTEPTGPNPGPVPDLPPDIPRPPIQEPEPDTLPDEIPNPNPDENDEPGKIVAALKSRRSHVRDEISKGVRVPLGPSRLSKVTLLVRLDGGRVKAI